MFKCLYVFLWLASAIADYSEFCYVWQLKEYRWDRFIDFLSTQQGKNFIIKSYKTLWRFLLITLILIFWLITKAIILKYIVVLVLTCELILNLYKFFKHNLQRPKLTVKSGLIIFLAIIIEGSIILLTMQWFIILFLLAVRLDIISLIISVFILPTKWIKKNYINKAKQKLAYLIETEVGLRGAPRSPTSVNLTVIGVTGSYGKTTVKNFLMHILSAKYNVIKTPKNINTDIGIAKFILKTDFSDTDIFIVEMGAYKIGEIKIICNMVQPKIGILTAINEQHLSLFGNLKNTQKAKYELLRSLPKTGLAIINSDNFYCREYVKQLDCAAQTFGTQQKYKPDYLVHNIRTAQDNKIAFSGLTKDNNQDEISAPIIGKHNAINIAPCILIANYLGIEYNQILEQCKTLKLPDNTLQIHNYGKSIILDDSHNSNPEGFRAALNVLKNYSSEYKKIVITRGMLELGKKSQKIHEKIGAKIAEIANELIIIKPDFASYLSHGAKGKYNLKITLQYNQQKLLKYIKTLKNKKCVVLLENRMFKKIYDFRF
ncbi:UDP-N-acetylmuramoyl-tripeptide--D-alanyl-D-alanine ligase [Patescibacteria group bacterium]|nr:UDP-N-acetylmuramoyl-tripeptide--D-alanyl-D-alanine ligase [Patescibacteria group bacterium]MBU1349862.1 UDP-N-acetylmuramoyl-tripeptide--D-alanyl-D-alanine ligase [Patescibacteria group bacterium]MBU1421430.1 UDP-N-acetylmuramoyl-tripeptide--D-alanyl-D-alanine ligase [Patescibacteria group bacterium]MBU2456852.1 UDP-N-acetylmuramoyl-tripeptide--D-alanyl-D-alanine ligase [Patescibacteria group bacterium]